jgi:hypothetical protein
MVGGAALRRATGRHEEVEMPSITERLETKKQLAECRVCGWLATLSEKDRKEWAQAIANPRFGYGLIANEIMVEIAARDGADVGSTYNGPAIGDSSVETHRRRSHR